MKKKSNKAILAVLTVVVVAISLLGSGIFSSLPPVQVEHRQEQETTVADQDSSPGALPPCMDSNSPVLEAYHIHPHLSIVVEGKNVIVPAEIGSSVGGCERMIHTHDDTGTIHVEPNSPMNFALGDFFAVWGKSFSRYKILDYPVDTRHEIVMTVNGKPSQDFEKLTLRDKQEIMIEYKKVGEK